MAFGSRRSGESWAAPVRAWTRRFAFVILTLAGLALIGLSKAESPAVERARMMIVDRATPVLAALGEPVQIAEELLARANDIVYLHAENQRLREENERLMQWRAYARELQIQNAALRAELDYVEDPEGRFITARVVADPGSAFVHSVLVNAGRRDGVRRGQPVMAGGGLIGRIAELGERSARVLLITDINSRIPILVQSTGDRAVLAGDNGPQPRLLYLPKNAAVESGDRVVTSGHGGIFPPGLAVGRLAPPERGASVRVQPETHYARLNHVRVLDFGPEGLLPPPDATAESARESAVAPAADSDGTDVLSTENGVR